MIKKLLFGFVFVQIFLVYLNFMAYGEFRFSTEFAVTNGFITFAVLTIILNIRKTEEKE